MSVMNTLYLDLDGVIYNWEGYVLDTYFPNHTIKELNKMPNRGVALRKMYEECPDLFLKLPILPNASELIARIKEI